MENALKLVQMACTVIEIIIHVIHVLNSVCNAKSRQIDA